MTFQAQPFLKLYEGLEGKEQFQIYLPKEIHWMTSAYFQDQTYEKFYNALNAFIIQIQRIKSLQLFNQQNQNSLQNLFRDQFNKTQFSLYAIEPQLKNAAEKLQISFYIVIMFQTQAFYGDKSHQQAKIIIEKLNIQQLRLSFIFGLQTLNNQIPKQNFNLAPNQGNQMNFQKNNFKQVFQQQLLFFPKKNQNLIESKSIQNFVPLKQIQIPVKEEISQQQPQVTPFTQVLTERSESDFVTSTCQLNDEQTNIEKSNFKLHDFKPKQIQTKQCDVCFEQYEGNSQQEIYLPCCQRIFHKCIQEQFTNTQENLWERKCFFCRQKFEMSFLKENIHSNIYQATINKQLQVQYFVECSNCKSKIIILPEQRIKILKIECENCKTSICSMCMSQFHGFTQICQGIRQEIIKCLQGQGQPIVICPFCDLIQTKNDGCNHVTCSQCNMNLCSECSADRRPIVSHGNHFHRKGCIDYRVETGKEKETKERNRQCELCKQSPDNCCYFPIDLETYKKEKGF